MPPALSIKVSLDALRRHPDLAQLPTRVSRRDLNAFINAVQDRPEGLVCVIQGKHSSTELRILLRASPNDRPMDRLGLPKPTYAMHEVCDLVAEATHVDPRRHTVFAKRGSIYEDFADDALIQPNYVVEGKPRTRHPLDPVSSEEIQQRRALHDNHWRPHKRKPAPIADFGVNDPKDWFFKRGVR